MLPVNNSNNQSFAKGVSSLLRPGLNPQINGKRRAFGCVLAKLLICIRERGGAHTPPENDHDKLTFVSKQAGF